MTETYWERRRRLEEEEKKKKENEIHTPKKP